jgi:heptosyltransferase-2
MKLIPKLFGVYVFSKLPDIRSFKHIAILQTAFLGDVALAMPFAQAIDDYCDTTEITFLTTPSAAQLVSCMPGVDNVISYDKRGLQSGKRGMEFVAEILREKKVDCIIAPHRSIRTTMITYLAKPVYSVGYDKNALSFLYKKRAKYYSHMHEVERLFQLFTAFSGTESMIKTIPDVKLEIDDDVHMFIDSKLSSLNITNKSKIVAVAPGSVWATKKWLESYFIELCSLLIKQGLEPILIGSAIDKGLCARIANASGANSFAGESSIPQTLCLLEKASLTITNDSAPTHFAGLVKCPTVTIFGPTSPIFGFAPRGVHDRVIEIEDLKCKPCEIHGSNKCPTGTFDCMKKILPHDVLKVCLDVLSKTGSNVENNEDNI